VEELGEQGSVLSRSLAGEQRRIGQEDELEIPVQVNGKLVMVVTVPPTPRVKPIEEAALAGEKVQARIAGKRVAKVIVCPASWSTWWSSNVAAPLRGTKSLVGQMGWVFARPWLTALEIAGAAVLGCRF